jgi:hypothetical protein
MGPIVAQVWVQLSHENRVVTSLNCLWSHVDWCQFCSSPQKINVHHFGMVEATLLKIWLRGHLQWHDLPAEFHQILLIGSKVINEGHKRTDSTVIS